MMKFYATIEALGDGFSIKLEEFLAPYQGRLILSDPIWPIQKQHGYLVQFTSEHPDLPRLLEQDLRDAKIYAYRIARGPMGP